MIINYSTEDVTAFDLTNQAINEYYDKLDKELMIMSEKEKVRLLLNKEKAFYNKKSKYKRKLKYNK